MAKKKVNKKAKPANIVRLAQAVAAIRSVDEATSFISDLLTEEEKRSLTKRLHIADWLSKGKTYEEIVSGIGTSMTTVARVSHWLKNAGAGYRLTTERVQSTGKKGTDGPKSSVTNRRGTSQKSKAKAAPVRRGGSAASLRSKKRK